MSKFLFAVALVVMAPLSNGLFGGKEVDQDPLLARIPELTVAQVAARYAQRLGGDGALRDMDSIRLRLEIRRDSGDLVRMTVLKKRPDRVRIMFSQQGINITQAFDGQTAWVRNQGQGIDRIRHMDSEEAERFIRDAPIEHVLLHAERMNAELKMVGRVRHSNRPCYEIHAHFANGDRYELLIDAEEFVDRRISRIIRRADGYTRTDIIPSRFEYISGILFALRYVYFIDGKRDSIVDVVEATVNPGLIEEIFRIPATPNAVP
ncbi:MAG: hypothetical protein JJT96_07285 [Opitutales bacterium]|nr:hypothetical protein [Opitutales bacterium]